MIMNKKRIAWTSLLAVLEYTLFAIIAIKFIFGIVFFIARPRERTCPLDFYPSVWECEYNGATITLLVNDSGFSRGYIDKDGERTYLAFSMDSIRQVVSLFPITEEQFDGSIDVLVYSQAILHASFNCTDACFTVRRATPEKRETDYWQTEGPIELVFFRVSE